MDALASHIWQSTIFALAAGALTWMFRRNGAPVRYWIWFAALMKFVVPIAALTAVANRIPLPQSPQAAGEALEAATSVFRSAAIPSIPSDSTNFVLAAWLLGACVVLLGWLWQWQRLIADARQSPPILDGIVHDALRRAEHAEGIADPTPLVASNRSTEPGVIGIWKPVLIWPRRLTPELHDTHIEAIVAHEACHIARRDNLLAAAQLFVCAVFWFHPLVWWIGARLIDERERACDEGVLALGRRPETYAESILKTCRLCVAPPAVVIAGVTGGDLKRRIRRIMQNEPARPLDSGRKGALLIAALVLLILPTATGVSACLPRRNVESPTAAGVVLPKLIRETKPQYTPRAMQEKVQGEVLMECVVKRDGTVGEVKVLKSLHPDLDQAALDAAAKWVFEPGTRNGKPVNVAVTVTMAFTLK
jgi:bla regulator protein BlaR1